MKKRYITIVILIIAVIFIWATEIINPIFYYTTNAKRAVKFGNYEYAIKNLEKSFELGNRKASDRELYVELLIKNDDGYITQQKLLKFYDDNINDSASDNAFDFLYDKETEAQNKYPSNYITQAPYNNKILRWGTKDITYAILNPSDAPEYFSSEIDNAVLNWNNNFKEVLNIKKSKSDADITIILHKKQSELNGGTKYVAAYTRPDINDDKLLGMQIDFYVNDINGNPFKPTAIYNTALHELGHALGIMGHSDNRNDVMYISANAITGRRAVFSTADINTIKLLYSTMPEITDVMPENADYIPYIVSGNNKKIIENKMKEAREYIKKAPKLPNGYIDLAEVFVNKKEYSSAINYLNKALNLSNDYEIIKMIYYDLAVVYNFNKEYDKADSAIKRAIDLGENGESAKHLYAQILYSLNNKEEAILEYQKLILDNPQNINYMIGLANIYIKDKAYLNARSVIRNYLKNNPADKNNPILKSYGILGKI